MYESDWVNLRLVDVEIPGGERFEHHVVRVPGSAAGVVVRDPERGVLLLWRHRFITDTWGWEIPAGHVDPGEDPEIAAAREVLEETGWRAGPLSPLFRYHPINGLTDQVFYVFLADGAVHEGEPHDRSESERVEWLTTARLRRALRKGEVLDGFSLTSLLWAVTFGHLPEGPELAPEPEVEWGS